MGQETEYRLIKEIWAQDGNRIAVRFVYEWQTADGDWIRRTGTRTGNSPRTV